MARQPRLNPRGGIHHITNHRAGNDDLFLTDRDRLLFLLLIEEARDKTGVHVLAYCLMGNHYHLILRCPSGQLDRFLHHLQGNYARAFNYRHDRKGPVFRRRYHSVLVTSDGQFQLAMRYVHRNPLELGYDIRTYPWSDYPSYYDKMLAAADIVTVDSVMVLRSFGGIASYRHHVETDSTHDKVRLAKGTRQVQVKAESSVPEDVTRLAMTIAQLIGCPVAEVTASVPGRRNDARLIATLLASERYGNNQVEVRSSLGFRNATTYRTALNRARHRLATDQEFATHVEASRTGWYAKSQDTAA